VRKKCNKSWLSDDKRHLYAGLIQFNLSVILNGQEKCQVSLIPVYLLLNAKIKLIKQCSTN